MRRRIACGAVALSAMLAGCAEFHQAMPDFPDLQLALAGLGPQSSQAPASLSVDRNDPAFRYSELKSGITTDRLQGMYGTRLVRMDGDGTYDRYVVEPSNATPGVPQQRSRLVLWVMDGHLATWAVEETNSPVAIAMALPQTQTVAARRAQPVAEVPAQRTRASAAAGSNFQVQIAARKSEDEARAAINDLRGKHPNLLGQRGALIYRVSLPQGVFYRAVVGPFGSSIQANELCGQLRAAGAECFVRAG